MRFLKGTFLLCAAIGISVLILLSSQVYRTSASINSTINFQGKVVNSNGTNIADSTYNMQFKIYTGGDGIIGGGDETLQWTESRLRNNAQGVGINDGVFQVNLGSVTSLPDVFNNDTVWLTMNVGNNNASCTPFSSCSPDGEMGPMIRLTAAPYALNSDKLGGLQASNFVQLAQGLQTDSSTTNASIAINKTGSTANILTLQKSGNNIFTIDNTGLSTFFSNTEFSLSGDETVAINQDLDATGGALTISGSPSATAASTYGLQIIQSNNSNTNGFDDAILISNTDNIAITNGIRFSNNGGGGYTQEFSLSNGLTIANADDNDLNLVENSATLNIDFAEATSSMITYSSASKLGFTSTNGSADGIVLTSTNGGIDITSTGAAAGEDIDVTTNASINLTSTEGASDGIVLTSTNGGMDFTSTGAAAGEDFDFTSSASVNITGQEAAIDAVTINSSAEGSGVRFKAGDQLPTSLADGNDIEFLAENNTLITLTAAGHFVIDAAANDSTVDSTTDGTIAFNIDGVPASAGINNGFFLDYEPIDDANANQTQRAMRIDLSNSSNDVADIIEGFSINNNDEGANTAIDSMIALVNSEATGNTVTDALVISGTAGASLDTITDAIDVSDDNITNAINIGTNFLVASSDSINDFTGNAGLVVTSNSLRVGLINATDGLSAITSSGSGLEIIGSGGSTGLALLQGCSNDQILKWNETSDVWACNTDQTGGGGSSTLDVVLAATGDGTAQANGTHPIIWNWALGSSTNTGLTLGETTAASSGGTILALNTISTSTASPLTITDGGTGNINFNLSSTGDYTIQDNTTTFASFDDSGGITFAPQSTSNINLTLDSDSSLLATGGSISQTPSTPVLKGSTDSVNAGTGTLFDANKVFIQGKYAYFAGGSGSGTCSSSTRDGCEMQIYDMSNPASPSYVGGAEALNTAATLTTAPSIYVSGKYAYLPNISDNSSSACSNGNHCELNIFDISNPSSPTFVSGIDSTNAGTGTISFNNIFVSGHYLYIVKSGNTGTCSSSTRDGCEFMIFDVSNPSVPEYLGGADSINQAAGNVRATAVYVNGKYAVVTNQSDASSTACFFGNHCEAIIWDISSPTSPSLVSYLDATNAGTGITSFNYATISGRYLYIAKGNNTGTCSSSTRDGCELMIFDFSNPSSATYIGGIDSNGANYASLFNSGRYLYVTTFGNSGTCSSVTRVGCEFQVFDVSDPTAATYLGGVESNNTSGISRAFNGVFVVGNYAYLASANDLSSSACSNGVHCEFMVYDISGIESTSLYSGSIYSGSLQIQNNSMFMSDLSIWGGLTVGQNLFVNGKLAAGNDIEASNLGITFQDSDTNPSCGSGDYEAYADTSETKLKICQNGTTMDILSGRNLSTNFGSLVSYGAFESKNSYFGEEFNVPKLNNASCTGSTTATVFSWARGDMGKHTVANGTCGTNSSLNGGEFSFSAKLGGTGAICSSASVTGTNGAERLTATGKSASGSGNANCALSLAETTTISHKIYTASERPVITMKVKPSTLLAANNARHFDVGLSADNSASAVGIGHPTGGAFFTNCSGYGSLAQPTGCSNTTWYGMVSRGGGQIGTTQTCTGTMSTTQFAYLRIEIRSNTDIHFYMDPDVSNGISETECGSGVSSDMCSAGCSQMAPWAHTVVDENVSTSTVLDIDYLRIWSDDNASSDNIVAPNGDPILTEPPLKLDTYDPSINKDFFSFLGASGEDQIFNHDVYVKGTLYADKIKANQIEGLDILASQFGKLSIASDNKSSPASDTTKDSNTNTLFDSTTALLDFSVNGLLTANTGLTVNGTAQFNGESIFDNLVTFNGSSLFKGDVSFEGRNTYNNDTGGFATIKAGSSSIDVKFTVPYEVEPVVILNISNGQFMQYSYKAIQNPVTQKYDGFTIYLNGSALTDTQCVWKALYIKDARIASNDVGALLQQ